MTTKDSSLSIRTKLKMKKEREQSLGKGFNWVGEKNSCYTDGLIKYLNGWRFRSERNASGSNACQFMHVKTNDFSIFQILN